MDIREVKRCDYNPRRMSELAKNGLRESIDDFGDISGISINKRTNNIFAGNHRFSEISTKFGRSNLVLKHMEGEWYALDLKDGNTTGFKVRVVDWDLEKEQLANVVANNDMITGEYTSDLQGLLKKIKVKVPSVSLAKLRVEPLMIDDSLECDLDLDDTFEVPEGVKEKIIEENTKDEVVDKKVHVEDDTMAPSAVTNIVSSIKVVVPSELADEVKFDIIDALSKKDYFNDVEVIRI